MKMPQVGKSRTEVIDAIGVMKQDDADWHSGRTWVYVYYADEALLEVIKQAYLTSFSENGLGPSAFPSLAKMEAEVLAISADLLNCQAAYGSMTSGGSESIFLALKTARDWARAHRADLGIPRVIMPSSAHPAFSKAAHYLHMEAIRIPVGEDYRANVSAMSDAIDRNAVLLVGSAPSYPQGVIDPIEELGALAQDAGLLFHVDACLGGLVLPFIKRFADNVPEFDFSVAGVTSMSADLHKYGYAAKGASVILHRSEELRDFQLYSFVDWPGGSYTVPNLAGTRPGGAIAAAWAAFQYLGEEGYMQLARRCMKATHDLQDGIEALPNLFVLGEPSGPLFAFGSAKSDISAIAQEMWNRQWLVGLQSSPPSIHLTVSAGHDRVVDAFLEDLGAAVKAASAESEQYHSIQARYS